jgi:HD-GYP domain-containing protein (c-di-GMP phosphodiesterase class II)
MIKSIQIEELKPGMYIILPRAWRSHPFISNRFTITSKKQIQKLVDYGITEINIDEMKGMPAESVMAEHEEPEKDFSDDLKNSAETLKDIITDKKVLPAARARAVQMHSVDMMKSLWLNPTGERIAEFKEGVVSVVDLILQDDATNSQLLKLTSYDYDTYIHSVNVGVLAISLAKVLLKKGDKHDMHALGAGFFLHDLGKVKIDEAIIKKPGKLTDEEMDLMRKHPSMGFKLLHETKQISIESRLIVLQHHERNHGGGYPRGLRGEDIHIYGRICSVADVFDALVSKRPYKAQLSPFHALKLMKDEMLDHFHKDVFEKFVLLFK